MGCNRTPTEKEAQQIHDAAVRVVSAVGGANTAEAERLVSMYGESGAIAILRERQQAQQQAWSEPQTNSYSFEQPVWASQQNWASQQREEQSRRDEQQRREEQSRREETQRREEQSRRDEQQRREEQQRIIEERRLEDGRILIRSEVGPPPSQGGDPRMGYERQYFPGVEVGLSGWDRGHSQGAGTGRESREGIRYETAEVNRVLKNQGVERFIRDAYEIASQNGGRVIQHTVTQTHPLTLRLSSIEYRVDIVAADGRTSRIFEAEITISNDRVEPRVNISVAEGGRWDE